MCDQTSIYIHIPFCVKKCVYCDFYSSTDLSLIPGFLECLQKEIETRANTEDKIDTIYFGGGTPSLLPVKDVKTILQTIEDHFTVSREAEKTLEVNPGKVDYNFLKELKKAGINRLSIGVQSFNNDKLAFLNRIHTAEQAVHTVNSAKKAGFDNVSMDLIYGVPFETKTTWLMDLKAAVKSVPSHLSCYMLTIEQDTPLDEKLKKGLITPLGSADRSGLFQITSRFLDAAGFEHYEISNFSRGSHNRSRHNSNYWNMTPYHGLGPAAHSYDGNTRSWNHRSIEKYIKDMASGRLPVEDQEMLTLDQKMLELIMLRLRTLEGLDLAEFKTLFDTSFETRFKDILEQVFEASFGFVKAGRFALTLEGKVRLNSIVEAFAGKIL